MTGMGSHQKTKGFKDEWLTPPQIVRDLGPFDLDPCSPINRPWPTAAKHYTIKDNGLMLPWYGRVWLNPPYGDQTQIWLNRLAAHGKGTALVFARTETEMFFREVWARATAIMFLKGRIRFHLVDGSKGEYTGGAPSCLIAYGPEDTKRLGECGIPGKFIMLGDRI